MLLFSKFTKQVESIFQLLPKRLEWISFYTNDLPLIMEICEDVRQISLENQLNKSQFKAISEVKKISSDSFQHIVNTTQSNSDSQNGIDPKIKNSASIVPLRDMSDYSTDSISTLSKNNYLTFLKSSSKLAFDYSKPTTRLQEPPS